MTYRIHIENGWRDICSCCEFEMPALFDRQLQSLCKEWSVDPGLFVLTCSEAICRMSPGLHVHVYEKASVKSSCQAFSLQRDCGPMTDEKALNISLCHVEQYFFLFIYLSLSPCTTVLKYDLFWNSQKIFALQLWLKKLHVKKCNVHLLS